MKILESFLDEIEKISSIPSVIVHPHRDESYRVGADDHCLVVSSGEKEESPQVHLSENMIDWIGRHGKSKIK